jgi:outer membrane protein assembly factor BamB
MRFIGLSNRLATVMLTLLLVSVFLCTQKIGISNQSSDLKIWSYKTNDIVVSVDYIVDITDDGVPEVVAGSQSTSSSTVYLLSGADGKELWHYNNWEYFYQVLTQIKSIPDVTGDDKPDVLIALLGGVYVLNGINGRRAWSIDLTGYARINYIDDVTNDGKPEVIMGATSEVRLVSGVNGKSLWTFFKSNFECTTITGLPDVTGDGLPDVLCGSENNLVYLLNSANGKMFWEFEADGLISSLSCIPDVSGDDVYDVLIGSDKGTVYLVSGCDGTELWNYEAESAITYHDGIACIPDVTGDEKSDVIIGSYDCNIYLLDCINKKVVWTFKTGNKVESVAYIHDVSGDGYVDILAGSRDKKIYLIDGKSGNKIWDYETEGYVYSVSCIPDVSGDGYFDVIAGSTDHNIYCLSGYYMSAVPSIMYILHVQSYPITGVKISYTGDISGSDDTNFDIRSSSAFTVTLTAPLYFDNYKYRLSYWKLDGNTVGVSKDDMAISVKIDDENKERTIKAVYVPRKFNPMWDGFGFSNNDFTETVSLKLDEIKQRLKEKPISMKIDEWLQVELIDLYQRYQKGYCSGMVLAAKYYYENPDKLPSGYKALIEVPKEEVISTIISYQHAWYFLDDYLLKWVLLQLGDEPCGLLSLEDQLAWLKSELNKGNVASAVVIGYPEDNGGQYISHAVLVVDYADEGSMITLRVYGPNKPESFQSVELVRDQNGKIKIAGGKTELEYFTISRIAIMDAPTIVSWEQISNHMSQIVNMIVNEIKKASLDLIDYFKQRFETLFAVKLHSAAELHIYNSDGKHVGLSEGSVYIGFPSIFYMDEEGAENFILPYPKPGNYKLLLTGKANGNYNLTIFTVRNGEITSRIVKTGYINKGEEQEININISPACDLEEQLKPPLDYYHLWIIVGLTLAISVTTAMIAFKKRKRM